jgi:ferredoxin-type protein NapH
MNEIQSAALQVQPGDAQAQHGCVRILLLMLPMFLLTAMMTSRGGIPSDLIRFTSWAATLAFINTLFFLMLRNRKTDRYRSILFITMAATFVLSFISNLIEARGSMMFTESDMIEGDIPFCHLVIPMTLIPAALTRTINFPGTILGPHAIVPMFVLWIGASLALGRGFCGWFCFFGGLDEGFSRILKKPVLRKIDPKWTYLPIAVLLVTVILAAVTLSPTYCEWLCPFKTVTEFAKVTSAKVLLQTVLFVSLFAGLVVVLPLLTKKRTQCGLFCPLGPVQALTNRINPFEISLNKGKCVQCMKCVSACPTFSIDERGVKEGGTKASCVKCGKCVDVCPKEALSFHVKGTPLSEGWAKRRELHRLLFLFPAFLVLATMAGGFIQDALVRIMRLITTGSLLT